MDPRPTQPIHNPTQPPYSIDVCRDAPNYKFSQSRIIASQRKVKYSYVRDICFANLPFQTQPTKTKIIDPPDQPNPTHEQFWSRVLTKRK